MKINKKIQKEIALAVLNTIEPNYTSMSRENQTFLFNNMSKAVHKFILKEYNRRQSMLETYEDAI
jgi:hypothetical protein